MKSTEQKIATVIVDDDLQGIRSLKNLNEQHCPELEIIQSCQSSMEALKVIPKLKVDTHGQALGTSVVLPLYDTE